MAKTQINESRKFNGKVEDVEHERNKAKKKRPKGKVKETKGVGVKRGPLGEVI